jgi:hypothetical protein
MATHVYSEQQIERIVGRMKRFRVWLYVVGALILVAGSFLVYFRSDLFAHHRRARDWTIGILIAIGSHLFGSLLLSFRRRESWSEKLRIRLRERSVEISSAAICVTFARQFKRQLSREEITRAEEQSLGKGLFLRTSNRHRYAVIPRNLGDYEAIKKEIVLLGIPIEKV